MVKICRALSSDTAALRGHTGHLLDCAQRRVDVTVLWALWVGFRLSECLFVAAFFLLISSSSKDFKKIKTSKEFFLDPMLQCVNRYDTVLSGMKG